MEQVFILYNAALAFLNIGAGRRFWGVVNSTQVCQVLFATGSAALVKAPAFIAMWVAYFLGGVPREHKYSVTVAEGIAFIVAAAMFWPYG